MENDLLLSVLGARRLFLYGICGASRLHAVESDTYLHEFRTCWDFIVNSTSFFTAIGSTMSTYHRQNLYLVYWC